MSNTYDAILKAIKDNFKEIPVNLMGIPVVVKQPTLNAFREAQSASSGITDPTNPDQVEAAEQRARSGSDSLYNLMLICTFEPGTDNLVFPNVDAVKALPFGTPGVTELVNAVTSVASMDSLIKEEEKNSEETSTEE